jgi:hypothetical protein
LIQAPDLRARLGAAGRRHAAQACRPDATALEYVDLYRRLAGNRPGSARNPAEVARAGS